MRMLNRFWRTLEGMPGQANIISEWKRATGEDFELVRHFLRPTDRRAKVFRCPSPGGDGCPRRVVDHGDGHIVAACASVERGCENLELTESDIIVYGLNQRRLGNEIAECLELQTTFSGMKGLRGCVRIGEDRYFPGKRFPAFIAFPSSREMASKIVSRLMVEVDGPFLLLTPTGRHVVPEIDGLLARSHALHLALVDFLGVNDADRLMVTQSSDVILAEFRAKVAPKPPTDLVPELFPTPSWASWENVTMEFHADEVMSVKCGSVVRRVEPEHMGMKNRKSGKPTLQWTLLRTLARTDGTIPLQSPKDHDRVKKQKSELSRKLKAYFQLPEDPIAWKPGEYLWEAAFRIRSINLREPISDANR
ncbi:MAG: hypothetical protein HQL72_02490 [Magnetococcales bacterium]|nr:hypothetical protein [Magnetococcales bacterium]